MCTYTRMSSDSWSQRLDLREGDKIYQELNPNSHLGFTPSSTKASLVALTVKNLPAMQETWVLSPSWEEPLEK